jgi:protein gp37
MASKTKIEWCDATWNIFSGCTSVSDGCTNCYARAMAQWQPAIHQEGKDFSEVVFHQDRLDVPLRWRKPRKIFVNSMSDIFHEQAVHAHPSWIAAVFAVAALSPRHTFMLLTKRPHLAVKWFEDYLRDDTAGVMSLAFERYYGTTEPDASGMIHNAVEKHWPLPNVWIGATIESQKYIDRVHNLLKCPARIHFVSHGPALGPLNFPPKTFGQGSDCPECGYMVSVDEDGCCISCGRDVMWYGIDWLITEGETGRNARPMHPEWAINDRDQCQKAKIPFFFKQWGVWAPRSIHLQKPKIKNTKFGVLNIDGNFHPWELGKGQDIDPVTNDAYMVRVGKKHSGRLLEGQEYSEFPEVI